ncbi:MULTISPECIES: hypothetical protein [unclassified Myxococcus]|uniref:DUF7003 family protein n=1 Tax=unclassified Myxococcus TaxID=2648731 RepID=UPI00157B3759|nr:MULTISPECIES: hypothetical protein [unclassified Myxococcus]NTX39970.1 hypothetical protein [Myxococcus sp. CA033]NTX53021.1 hypothetical protein [Myxococcus sp. CA039A]
MPSSAEAILAQLDQAAEDYVFPMLDNGYVYLVDARLHVFSDDERWALVIEVVGYAPRGGVLANTLHLYGEPLGRRPGTANSDILYPVEGAHEDAEHPERARPGLKELSIRGRKISLPPHEDPWALTDLYRSVVPEHRDLLFATEDELGSRLSPGIPKLLQLESWHHPDLAGEERPSESETFVQLAQAIARRDASLYRPSRPPNTHWKNWPDGGAL